MCPEKTICNLFYKVEMISALVNKIKRYYCKRNYQKCIRYIKIINGENIPHNLLPNDQILTKAKIQLEQV